MFRFGMQTTRSMTIDTERLFLREFLPEDAGQVYKLHSDPDVMKFISTPMAQSVDDADRFIEKQLRYYREYEGLGIFPVFTREHGLFAGWAALKQLDLSSKIEVGYRLHKKFWGMGFATEITRRLLRHAFEDLQLTEIYAVTDPRHLRSQQVLTKCGLRLIGTDHFYQKDLFVFRITNKG